MSKYDYFQIVPMRSRNPRRSGKIVAEMTTPDQAEYWALYGHAPIWSSTVVLLDGYQALNRYPYFEHILDRKYLSEIWMAGRQVAGGRPLELIDCREKAA